MNMIIRSGGADIIKSGVVSSFCNEPIEFTFLVSKVKSFFRVSTLIDQGVAGQEIRRLPNKNYLDIVFVNPHLSPFVKTNSLEKLGTIDGRHLSCILKLETVGTPTEIFYSTLTYTFYLDGIPDQDVDSIEIEV